MKKSLSLLLVSILCLFMQVRSETRIFLLDNSGSMFGKGYELATYGNVFDKAKESLAAHIKDLPDSVNVIVAPFCRHLDHQITGSNTEIAQNVLSLDYVPGESDISQTWAEAQDLKASGNTIYFLITDAFDNVGYDDDMERYADYYSSNATDDEITYLYLVSDQLKGTSLAQKFIDLPHLDVTDTFDVNPFYTEPEQPVLAPTIEEEDPAVEQAEDTSFSLWWLLLLLIILILLIILATKHYFSKLSRNQYLIKKDERPHNGKEINKENRTAEEICKNPLTEECIQNMKNGAQEALGNLGDNIDTDKLTNNAIKLLGRPIDRPKKSKISNSVEFSRSAVFKVKAPTLEEAEEYFRSHGRDLTTIKPNDFRNGSRQSGGQYHYDIMRKAVGKKIAEMSGISDLTDAEYIKIGMYYIAQGDYAIHESLEDGYLYLVPNNFHEYLSHYGLAQHRAKQLNEIGQRMK